MASSSQAALGAAGSDVLALTPTPPEALSTRKHLRRTPLADRYEVIQPSRHADAETGRASLVTRRQAWLRRRRKRRVLTAIALLLALFPPVWAVYLIGWLVWRSRPRQQSLRDVRKAVKALEKGRTGQAMQLLQAAHFADPHNSDALYWLGLLLSQQQRPEEAQEALSLVAERIPGLPEVEAALVDAYVALEQPDAAVHHAQRLLEVAPYAPQTLLKLADAFEAAGRLDLAVEALQQAPLHKRTLSDELLRVHYRLGTLYEQLQEPEKALHHFKRVYARDVHFADVQARVAALEA